MIRGWECEEGSVEFSSKCETVCGDGVRVGEEQCDDGNTVDSDGC